MGTFWEAIKQGFKEGWSGGSEPMPQDGARSELRVIVTVEEGRDVASSEQKQALRDEGADFRGDALKRLGVDLEQFTEKRAISDLNGFLDGFAPGWHLLSLDLSRACVRLDPKNLTQAGNVPKNVLEAHLDVSSFPASEDAVYAHIKYLADGKVNMADIHVWHKRVRHSIYIRTVEGAFQITSVETHDLERDYRKLLFAEKKPVGSEEAKRIFADALKLTLEEKR